VNIGRLRNCGCSRFDNGRGKNDGRIQHMGSLMAERGIPGLVAARCHGTPPNRNDEEIQLE